MIGNRSSEPGPKTTLPKGVIDTQLHVYQPGYPALPGGPELPARYASVEDYKDVMKRLGIDRFVLTQGNAHQHDDANLLAALAEARDIARGVAVISAKTSEDEMAVLAEAGVTGARIMDLPGGAVGLDQLEEVDARAHAAGWMMAVQFNGSHISDHFERLAALRSNWVFDHHGKFFRGASPDGPEIALTKRLIDSGRCWFKFAGCYESSRDGGPKFHDIAAIARVMASHAPERVVWGTNFPHNAATSEADYPDDAELLDTVLGWFPDDRTRHLALVENPETLYGFTPVR